MTRPNRPKASWFLTLCLILPHIIFAQEPTFSETVYQDAYNLVGERRFTEAIEQFKVFIELEQNTSRPDQGKISECLNNIGTCYHNLGNYTEAITWYNLALQIDLKLPNIESISTRYSNIGLAFRKIGNTDSALYYYQKALKLNEGTGDTAAIAKVLNNLGTLYHQLAKYDTTILYLERSLEIKKNIRDTTGVAITLNNIGLVYNSWQKYDHAIEYFQEAMHIDSLMGNTWEMATRLNNIGTSYHKKDDYSKAIEYFSKALGLGLEINNKDLVAKLYNNIGMIYLTREDFRQSADYLNKALEAYEQLGQTAEIATVLSNLSEINFKLGAYNIALDYLSQSNQIALNIDFFDLVKDNYLKFSDIYTSMGNYSEALNYYKKYTALKDTLYSEAIHKQISDFEIKYETEKKDKEITLLKQRQEIQELRIKRQRALQFSLIGGITLLLSLAVVILISLYQKKKDNRIIAREKAQSDKLLLNILPASIASDLKEKGTTEPRLYKNATVCFTDLVGFTEKSACMDPKLLIEELNLIFTAFDTIIERNHCERIKTIGDSYMAICGVPDPNPHHPEHIIRSSVEMVQYIEKKNLESDIEWQIRIGIHSGDVIAGVVGIKKYIYDVFGDTINTASRIETASEPMRINVSESTYLLVKDRFKFEERGEVTVKGKGAMKMYFIKS